MTQKTWGGRFAQPTDARVEAFTESISFDQRLFRHDIAASIAHARMLAQVGLLTASEAEQVANTLRAIENRIASGQLPFRIELEDIHSHVEHALIAEMGDLGRKLHTGRSRNDQVVTDLKLWCRDAIDQIDGQLAELQRAWIDFAEREGETILPGYTHLQRAQPILAAHYALAYVEKFHRDRGRLNDTRRRLNELPLGAAALAGTSLPIDRESVAQALDFERVAANSLDVSSDRDFVLEFAFALTTVALHLSSWAEEWILWASVEFGFLELPDAFCTGSSIMPHKKNPDVLELTRGKSARVVGGLVQLLTLVKGLPLAYNRDLQEDKRAIFDSVDTVAGCLAVASPLIRQTRLRREAIAARLDDGFLDATTLMEALIQEGLPMRSAHEAVGRLVRACEERRCRLADLPSDLFDGLAPGLHTKVAPKLGAANSLLAFRSQGSTAPDLVRAELAKWKVRLAATTGLA